MPMTEHMNVRVLFMVHGNCVSVGCYAMTDEKIEEIYNLVEAALAIRRSMYTYMHLHSV